MVEIPSRQRSRRRRGSLERPVNGRVYRGTCLLLGVPLLIAAFSVMRPEPLPAPLVPPTFDATAALMLTEDLARTYPVRTPGSAGAAGAARWVSERFRDYGFDVQTETFVQRVAGLGTVRLRNLRAVVAGRSPEVLLVTAHRDGSREGPGANDNASGTAALIELARAYAPGPATRGAQSGPLHTLVFLSTDGGAFGALGAAHFADQAAYGDRITAVVSLDALAGGSPARVEFRGDSARGASASLVQTASDRVLEQTGERARHPGMLSQLLDLGFPFSLREQAPFVSAGVPAVTLTTSGERPPAAFDDSVPQLARGRLDELGRSAQSLVQSLDSGFDLSLGPASYLYTGERAVPGWAVRLVLVAALMPFLAAAVDLFARCRRRRIALAPAVRSLLSRFAFWLVVGCLFGGFWLLGAWPAGSGRPLALETAAAGDWPVLALGVLGLLSALAWLLVRERLIPRRAVASSEELAGYTVALLALGVLALVVVTVNTYALAVLLPALHAWLWLPQTRGFSAWTRLLVLAVGFLGPLVFLVSFATRYGMGLDTPWYLLALVSVGYISPLAVVLLLAWAAPTAQLVALVAHRYAPYPARHERPTHGLLRRTAHALAARRRRAREPELAEAS